MATHASQEHRFLFFCPWFYAVRTNKSLLVKTYLCIHYRATQNDFLNLFLLAYLLWFKGLNIIGAFLNLPFDFQLFLILSDEEKSFLRFSLTSCLSLMSIVMFLLEKKNGDTTVDAESPTQHLGLLTTVPPCSLHESPLYP